MNVPTGFSRGFDAVIPTPQQVAAAAGGGCWLLPPAPRIASRDPAWPV